MSPVDIEDVNAILRKNTSEEKEAMARFIEQTEGIPETKPGYDPVAQRAKKRWFKRAVYSIKNLFVR